MAHDWQLVGLILALELIFATGVAVWTRWSANAKLQGQTIWHVAVGVFGVISLAGLRIGFDAIGFLMLCFTLAAVPMGIEYFGRLHREAVEAQKVREEAVDGHAGADRKE
ncbi:hypothetical protein FBQ81_03430 [Chloroflexi bacterium CFX6]|nr:hypothetical protein [Chloroflexi bacterium CFX6]